MATMVLRKHGQLFVPNTLEEEDEHCSCCEGEVEVLQREEKYVSDGEILKFPGPLMRDNLQKDKLMKFIQQKYEDCLLHLDDPEQQYSYFFWTIMERFLKKNGRVMMAEMAALLFKGFGLLSQKVRHLEHSGTWCLHLARLLCSTEPRDQQREAVIKMGDEFENRGWTYAAHICYVLAQVDLGSHPRFSLIGCNSLPKEKSTMREVLEKTEVYEYLLFLSSGFGQVHFQDSKCIYAHELAKDGHEVLATLYFQIITTTILKFPDRIQSDVVELLISLSEKVLQTQKAEEPEWLMKLRQLLPDDTEHCSTSDEEKESIFKTEQHLVFDPSVHSEFDSRYTVGELLGEGGYGSVYAGIRKADKLPVAIKVLARHPFDDRMTIPGEKRKLPREVALIKMVSEAPRCENVVELLEWFKTSHIYILVLERPVPCMDLFCFISQKDRLSERVARKVMWQLVQAVDHCYKRGVFHRDIKLENILINPDTLAVKLIDFGCGELVTDKPYWDFSGTQGYYPPEWVLEREYMGVPHAVWSLGVVLYAMISGSSPFIDDDDLINGQLCLLSYGSKDCWDLIQLCLQRDPDSRPDFSKILTHKWFKKERTQD